MIVKSIFDSYCLCYAIVQLNFQHLVQNQISS